MRLSIIIPARFGAQRLPGKPLADIGGAPMVVRVAQACARAKREAAIDEIAVATDDERIVGAVEAAGFRALRTSPGCRNGTERVAEANRTLGADVVLNVQGDEPLTQAAAVVALASLLRTGVPYGTLARPLEPGEEGNPAVVKVVLDGSGRALYFSRSLIPFPRAQAGLSPLAHLGLYGYSRAFLEQMVALPETELERTESLEQLRALFHGHPLFVRTGAFHSHAVDTPEDLERVRALFRDSNEPERRTA